MVIAIAGNSYAALNSASLNSGELNFFILGIIIMQTDVGILARYRCHRPLTLYFSVIAI